MKRVLFLLFFIFVNLFASTFLYRRIVNNKTTYILINALFNKNVSTNDCTYLNKDLYISPKFLYTILSKRSLNLNFTCLKNNNSLKTSCSKYDSSSGIRETVFSNINNINFCLVHSGYKYVSSLNAWVSDSNSSVLCPSGQHFSSKQEKCVVTPSCPDSSVLDQMAIKKCGSLQWTKIEMCDPDTGNINITCKTCIDVYNYVKQFCSVNFDSNVSHFSCKQNADGSLSVSVNPSDLNSSVCLIKHSDVNNTDTHISDNNSTVSGSSSSGTSVSSDVNTSSNYNYNSISNNVSDNNNHSNDKNTTFNSVCPDPCYLYNNKPLGFQTSVTSVNGFDCYIVTYPSFNNCKLSYHILKGKCVPGCGNDVLSGSSKDGNISMNLSPLTSRLDKANDKLSDIDKSLHNLQNVKPDSNFSVKGSSSLANSFLSQYSDFFNNLKSDISNLQNSYNSAKSVLSKNNYSLNLNSDSVSCPIVTDIYGRRQTVDVCRFVSPYKPFISLAFTFFFNLSVVLFFLKLIISSRSEL